MVTIAFTPPPVRTSFPDAQPEPLLHPGAAAGRRSPVRAARPGWPAGPGGDRRRRVPPVAPGAARRADRGGPVLRDLRVPHHRAAAARGRLHPEDASAAVLDAPAAPAGPGDGAVRAGVLLPGLAGGRGRRGAAAPPGARRPDVHRQLDQHRRGQRLLPGHQPRGVHQLLVPGRGGAVLPGLAGAAGADLPAGGHLAASAPGARGAGRGLPAGDARAVLGHRKRRPGVLRPGHPRLRTDARGVPGPADPLVHVPAEARLPDPPAGRGLLPRTQRRADPGGLGEPGPAAGRGAPAQ